MDVSELTKAQVTAEADRLVRKALDHIEAAQREIEKACQALCPIRGGLQEYERTNKLSLAIDRRWHQLRGFAEKRRGALDLDEFGRSNLAKVLGSTP